jgi:hypothetical protein
LRTKKPSYKESGKEVCSYKRINHFKEQIQCKETIQIPKEVVENIKLQI